MRIPACRTLLAIALFVSLATGVAVAADESSEEQKKNWENKTELGLTSTSGNAEVTNLSFGNVYKRHWTKAELTFDLAAINNRSVEKYWTGPIGDEEVVDRTTTTAETYAAGLGYRRDITKRLFWAAGVRWFRNEPAGLLDRYRALGGIGYTFVDSARHNLRGELGATYSEDTKVVPTTVDASGEVTENYTSATALVVYKFKISDSSELTSDLSGFYDVSDSENWQYNWITTLSASMTSNLALQVSYKVVYDNLPGFIDIPAGPGAGGTDTFSVRADKTDTFLTASVVLNF